MNRHDEEFWEYYKNLYFEQLGIIQADTAVIILYNGEKSIPSERWITN